MDSLLKNTLTELIPYKAPLNEIEGPHNLGTYNKNINRSIMRINALKTSELVAWYNYLNKFYHSIDVLNEYELSAARLRSRMKNVVSMLGEKVKSLNIHNITASELIVKFLSVYVCLYHLFIIILLIDIYTEIIT